MYANELLDQYKYEKRYIQDKQIAHDLNLTPQKLSNIRKGLRQMTENEALFIAEVIGADKETVLVNLAVDRAKTFETQTLWSNIAKKYNELNLSAISTSCVIFSLSLKCALCDILLNKSMTYVKICRISNGDNLVILQGYYYETKQHA